MLNTRKCFECTFDHRFLEMIVSNIPISYPFCGNLICKKPMMISPTRSNECLTSTVSQVEEDEDGSLVIPSVTPEHEGVYTITANNTADGDPQTETIRLEIGNFSTFSILNQPIISCLILKYRLITLPFFFEMFGSFSRWLYKDF